VHSSLLLRYGQSYALSEEGYLRVSHFSTALSRHYFGPPFILAHYYKYCTLEGVIEDIERAKNIINKVPAWEMMFIPSYVATAFIILLNRIIPFEAIWLPAFELHNKKIIP